MAKRRRQSHPKGADKSRGAPAYVPLTFALRAWRHEQDVGCPLLRERAETDLFTIHAYPGDVAGSYTISVEEYDEEVASLATFRELAEFLALTPKALAAVWKRRGLPSDWLPEDFDEPMPDPYCYLDELEDLAPFTTLADLLAQVPERFELSPADRERLAARGSPELPHPLGEVVMTEGIRPGDATKYYDVATGLGLACLQFMLDAAGANAIIETD